jgi:hypothetical protein
MVFVVLFLLYREARVGRLGCSGYDVGLVVLCFSVGGNNGRRYVAA